MHHGGSADRETGFDVLILTSGVWFLAKFLRYAFPPLFPQLRDLYGVSNGVLGAAFTAMMLVYALLQFPAGVVADRLGAARVVAAGVAVTGGGGAGARGAGAADGTGRRDGARGVRDGRAQDGRG